MNEVLFLAFFVILNLGILFAARISKGLVFAGIAAFAILMNIFVLKPFEIFGFEIYGGNALYGAIFLATDLLAENFSRRDAFLGVAAGFFGLAIYFCAAFFFVAIEPNFAVENSLEIQNALQTLFAPAWQIALASVTAFLISNSFDVFAFDFLKTKTRGRFLWLRNNLSTIVSQAFDTLIFTAIVSAFGIFEWKFFGEIIAFNLIFKIVLAFLDTPFLYF